MSLIKSKIIAGTSIMIFSILIGSLLSLFDFAQNMELIFQNSLYREGKITQELVIVGVDEQSTKGEPEGLGPYNTWSKSIWANTIRNIDEDNPKVIGIDFIFKESSNFVPLSTIQDLYFKTLEQEDLKKIVDEFIKSYSQKETPEDKNFAESLSEIRDKVVLAFTLQPDGIKNFPLDLYVQSVDSVGYVNTKTDSLGAVRSFVPNFNQEKDFGVLVSEKYMGKEILFDNKNEEKYVNFFGKPFSYKIISFSEVAKRNIEKGFFKDKIVLIGITNKAIPGDKYYTPINKDLLMPGVEFRANQIQSLIENKLLENAGKLMEFLLILAFSIISSFIFLSLRGLVSSIIVILEVLFYYLLAYFSFSKEIILPFSPILFIIFFIYIFSFAYRYFISDRQGRELKGAFSKYVSAELVEKISKNPEIVKLGGEKRVVTVFFMDIKDSTSISEKVEITKWVSQLNEYFTMMESIVKSRGGTVDKFEGDAIMGFFGAPLEQKDQVLKAFLCALDMKEMLTKLHEKWAKDGLPLIEFRIGINTGEAIVGNIGSINRFDYTAMGDTVNTASRMESGVNKTYKTQIISANFENHTEIEMLKKYIVLREIDSAIMLGKTTPTRLYEIVCKTTQFTQNIQNILSVYAEALNEYRQKHFEKAKSLFASISQIDPPSKVMEDRLVLLLENPNREFVDEQMNFKLDRK